MKTLGSFFVPTLLALVMTASLAAAQTESVIHTFTGGSDGGSPNGTMILDSKGNLYGTTSSGGLNLSCQCGTVFEFVRGANGSWTQNVLYSFGSLANEADGVAPQGRLTFDGKGNLYGTTLAGGSSFAGTVFELSPGSNGTWTEKVLYNFTNGADGGNPYTGVVFDSAGNLYGVASGGTYGFGAVFELIRQADGTWMQKILHSFAGNNDGAYPSGPLVLDPLGNVYGVAPQGGTHDYGLVFELVQGSNGNWAERSLYTFLGGSAGSNPLDGLIRDGAGNLYGVASLIAYELSPGSSGKWTAKTLHTFSGGADGATPVAALAFDGGGNIYGTTYTGGAHRGTVFELSPGANGTWSEKILHRFSGTGADGVFPTTTAPVIDSSGNVFGTTQRGGTSNAGVLFEIVP